MIAEAVDAAQMVIVKGEAKARSGHFIEMENQSKHPTQPHAMASSEPNSTARGSYITLIFIMAEKKSMFYTQQSIEIIEAKTYPEAPHHPKSSKK